MAKNSDLTVQQRAALADPVRLIEAGPGTGKTRTVVARLREQSNITSGVALLSFTNCAVDVARSRCLDQPGVLTAPNFVGTFDQFFHRYVVTPDQVRRKGKAPTYVRSWDDLSDHIARVRPGKGVGIRLSCFLPRNGTYVPAVARFNRSEQHYWDTVSPWTRQQIATQGAERLRNLLDSCVLDTVAAREVTKAILSNPGDATLGRLAARFTEVIVDEFQDCDALEHELLELLTGAGIRVVAVADPDQAIYGFRQASTGHYEEYRSRLAPDSIVSLTQCHRSTPAICALATSLRTVGQGALTSTVGSDGPAPTVQVVVGGGVKAGALALSIVRRFGIDGGRTRVLAHRRSEARNSLRGGNEPPHGTSFMEQILVPISDYRGAHDARARLRAVRQIERAVLAMVDWPGPAPLTRAEQVDALGITDVELRIIASQIVAASHGWDSAKACVSSLKRLLATNGARFRIGFGAPSNVSRYVRIPPESVWNYWESRAADVLVDAERHRVKWAHVHGVKGEEFEAVVHVLPARSTPDGHVLDDWQQGHGTESRRVFYVGVTRAERLVVLIVSAKKRAQLEEILNSEGIGYEISIA